MSSLLENDKIHHLSLASNPKLTSSAFKYIAIYIKGVGSLYSQKKKKKKPELTVSLAGLSINKPGPLLYTARQKEHSILDCSDIEARHGLT